MYPGKLIMAESKEVVNEMNIYKQDSIICYHNLAGWNYHRTSCNAHTEWCGYPRNRIYVGKEVAGKLKHKGGK